MTSHLSSSVPRVTVWELYVFSKKDKSHFFILFFLNIHSEQGNTDSAFVFFPTPNTCKKYLTSSVRKTHNNDIKFALLFPFPFTYSIRNYDKSLSVSLREIS